MTDAEKIVELQRRVDELTQKLSTREWIGTIVAVLSFLFTIFVWWRSRANSAKAQTQADAALAEAQKANTLSEKSNALAEQANTLAQQSNLVHAGQAELALIEAIDEAWGKVDELGAELRSIIKGRPRSELNKGELRMVDSAETQLRGRLQGWLNKYEAACLLYRNKKLDPEQFKRYFHRKIREVMEAEDEDIKAVLNLGPTTPYKALVAVYQEFHDHGA